MRESKAAYVAANGLRLADWVMTRLDLVAALGQPGRPAGQLGPRQSAGALADGEDAGHRPGAEAAARCTARSFLRRAARRRLTRPARRSRQKVLYFVDTSTPIITTRNWPRPWWP